MTFTIICLDGFRYDYLQKTNFLKELAGKGIYGRLFHGFGYASEFSAITGKDVEEMGIIANNFIRKEKGIRFYDFFKFLGNSRKTRIFLDLIYNAREFIMGNNQPKSIFNVPLNYSRYFDFLMKKNFFSQDIEGNKTIFDIFKEKNKKTIGYMWPFIYKNNQTKIDLLNLNLNTSKADDRTFQKSIKMLKKKPEIAYIHFFSTDNLVHKLGVNSRETLNLVNKLDNFVKEISKYSDSMLIFSDHGMIDVKKTWNLWEEIKKLNLVYGKDYIMFLDSTLARFWFRNKLAEKEVKNFLNKSKNGKIVNFKNPNIKKYFGEIIFQADPGILILPNFYQDKSEKAMHGYSDECREEQGLYIFYKEGIKKKKKDMKIKKIFNIIASNL